MSDSVQCCPYVFKDEFERVQCEHPVYKDHERCVFHSDRIQEKESDFYKAFAKWIVLCTQKLDVIDLRGFTFPELKLEDIVFTKFVDFRGAVFTDNLFLHNVVFAEGADFSHARFERQFILKGTTSNQSLKFSHAEFADDVIIHNEQFECRLQFDCAQFRKNADFGSSIFLDNCDFRKTLFAGKTVFRNARFALGGEFSECTFADEADFSLCTMDQSSDFRAAQFKGDVVFHSARFSELASFWMVNFNGNAVFREATFSGNVIFWMCNFVGIADFRKTFFYQRAEFKGATFYNEIMLNRSRLQFLKELDATGVNMEGTVLNASHFWGVDRIEDYSFQDAFLLSNNFSGKDFVNCDFTGAVFDSVQTRDWTLDENTIAKTKYIFAGFIKETEVDEYGERRDIYKQKEDSRIPAKGYFNEGSNEGFTFAHVFRQWQRKFVLFEVPRPLHDAFRQYLAMFGAYVRWVFQEECAVECRSEGAFLRVHLLAGDRLSYEMLDSRVSAFLRPVFVYQNQEPQIHLDDPAAVDIARFQFHEAVDAVHNTIALYLSKCEKSQRSKAMFALGRLIRDWSILSGETTHSDENLEAYIEEMFHFVPQESVEQEQAYISSVEPGPDGEVDILEVRFALDDLESLLLQIRDEIPGLAVKISGIQRELDKVRQEDDEEALLHQQRKRIEKIVERSVSLVSPEPRGTGKKSRRAPEVVAVCNTISVLTGMAVTV